MLYPMFVLSRFSLACYITLDIRNENACRTFHLYFYLPPFVTKRNTYSFYFALLSPRLEREESVQIP